MKLDKKSLTQYAAAELPRFEAKLKDFVEVPSVSADPERKGDIQRIAELAADTIRELGGEARIVPTDGNPLVLGSFRGADGAPTVTLYNHLDVQPASRESEPWKTD